MVLCVIVFVPHHFKLFYLLVILLNILGIDVRLRNMYGQITVISCNYCIIVFVCYACFNQFFLFYRFFLK